MRIRRLISVTPQKATKKTHELVAEQLRDRILSGELADGDRLPPEDELTAKFGIARTTLREALRVLESQGLLTIRRGRGGGPVVTHPSLEPAAMALAVSLRLQGATVGDLDSARQLIEPQIAGELARHHSADDITALEEAIGAAAKAAEENDLQAFGAAAVHVHATLVERSGNITLTMLSSLLHVMVNAYYATAIRRTDQPSMRRAVRSYRRLVELIVAGDAEAAIAHWRALMSYTITSYDPDSPLTLSASR
jgi:GntR family transcriptional repressor for pyruvate dehydrogenase complex